MAPGTFALSANNTFFAGMLLVWGCFRVISVVCDMGSETAGWGRCHLPSGWLAGGRGQLKCRTFVTGFSRTQHVWFDQSAGCAALIYPRRR